MVLTLDGAADAAGVAGAWFVQTAVVALITGAAVAQLCVNSHWLSQWNPSFLTLPHRIDVPYLWLKTLSQVIKSTTSTAVQHLVKIRPWGFLGKR